MFTYVIRMHALSYTFIGVGYCTYTISWNDAANESHYPAYGYNHWQARRVTSSVR
jgi:hypothetical protein